MLSDEEDRLIDYVEETYGCHTVILYGSRALGTHRADSDWDFIGLKADGPETFCHTRLEGVGELNGYIYPEAMGIFNPTAPSSLFVPLDPFVSRLRDAVVLVEEGSLGRDIVERARRMQRSGPPAITADKRAHTAHYFFDLRLADYLDTAPRKPGTPNALRDYMRHEVLMNSIFHYFRLRAMWVPAPNDWHAYLLQHDPAFLALLEQAEAKDAGRDAFAALFTHVLAGE